MGDYIQNLNSLASVTSLSQLKLDGEGQLEKRSALDTLGHRIADAFRSLSAAGRTAITVRNVELFSAMQKAVNESTHHEVFIAREAGGRLEATLGRLQNRVDRNALFSQIKSEVTSDPRLAALPKASRNALQRGLESIAAEQPRTEWRGLMNALRDTFLGVEPEGFDLEKGAQKFSDGLREKFFKRDVARMDQFGFHYSFNQDYPRACIKQVGNTPLSGHQTPEHYRGVLTDFLKSFSSDAATQEKDMRFLPFLSVAATQDGTASACPLLARDSGHDFLKTFLAAGISSPVGTTGHSTTISRDPENPRHILIQTVASQPYAHVEDPSSQALQMDAHITMRIDLDGEPQKQTINGKDWYLPSFTLENASAALSNPVDIVKADPRFNALPAHSQDALLKALGKVSHDEARMQRLKDDFFGLSTGDMRKADADFAKDLRETFLNPAQQAHMKENDFFDNFGKDMMRGAVSSINGQPVPRGQSDGFYEDLFRKVLPEEHHLLIPFLSMMCSQAGLDSAKVGVPYFSGLTGLLTPHLSDVDIHEPHRTASHSISMTIEGSRITLKEDFVQRFANFDSDWENGDPIPLAIKGSATMVIDLDGIIDVETVNGKDIYLPPFHIENCEAQFVPGEASYLRAN
ncbi:MAG: hypothetical protein IKY97_07420 [Mailhella sp.]|nr:hypothetical protein [Mailhella sp.]